MTRKAGRPCKAAKEVLSGIRVIELGSFITGPYAGLLLADLGADVIKVEPPTGDPFRAFGSGKYSPNFVAYNRGKRSVIIDLTQEAGREQLLELIITADVLIENFRPGVLERFNLGYANLRKINQRLIFCSISGFNRTGENRTRPAFDMIGQSIGGMLGLFLDPKKPIVRGPTISDQLAGFYGCYGILGALFGRIATGKGRRVDVNMVEATMSFMPDVFASYTREKVVMDSRTRPAYSQAYAFACRDNKLVGLQLSSPDKFWQGLVQAIEAPELIQDERFATRMQRIKNYDALTDLLGELFRKRDRDEWMRRLTDADVPHAPINRIDEVFSDPEVRLNDSFYDVEHPSMGRLRCLRRPVLYDGGRPSSGRAPPLLGEHSDAILPSVGPAKRRTQAGRLKKRSAKRLEK